jgi:hydrogenase/urease accessory protein HupE
MRFIFIGFAVLFSFVSETIADEYRPAYLQLKEIQSNTFDMLWKVPALGVSRLSLYVGLPENTEIKVPARSAFVSSAFIERSTIQAPGGLAGQEITIEGLEKVSTEVLVRIEYLSGATESARLTASSPSFTLLGAPTRLDVVNTYLVFGVEHILNGMDHLLFVACLIFIAGTWRRILITITGFTLAHSITLTLAALNLVRLPVPPIEAVIALSIVFLAREIALERRNTLTWRYPIAVSATFGLLHGFGFASALSELGLPQTEIPAALLAFNVGVEIGQILFVATLLAVAWLALRIFRAFDRSSKNWFPVFVKSAAYGIGGVSTLWTMERVATFWN